MFEKIIYIGDTDVDIKLASSNMIQGDIMNMPIVLEDSSKSILAEIKDLNPEFVKAKMLGELVNGKFIGGILRKPNLDARIRSLTEGELSYIVGEERPGNLLLGISPFYNSKKIYVFKGISFKTSKYLLSLESCATAVVPFKRLSSTPFLNEAIFSSLVMQK